MVRVVGVRFKKAGKVYYFDPAEFPVSAGSKVVVETARGVEYGDVAVGPKDVPEEQVVQPLKKVLRIGTDKDALVAAENKRKEREAFAIALKKIEAHALDMNLVDVEYTFDGSKNIFYFTAEGRVDFRDLVRDLAGVFRTRIEMRQIGVRDEAKLLGGIGPCGRILCCTSFLGDFAPVSIRMAKDQNLSLNPSKISGLCGRLMCCLRYEQETYEAAKKDPTLAPGYVNPLAAAAEASVRDLEELEEDPRPRIGLRSSDDSGMGSARIARAVTQLDRPRLQEEPAEPIRRSQGERPAGGPDRLGRPGHGGGRPQGQNPAQRPPQNSAPRREHDGRPQGERQQQERRPQQQLQQPQKLQQPRPQNPNQPRPQTQGQPRQQQSQPAQGQGGQQPRKGGQPNPAPQGQERPQGERQHRNRHRGNRPRGERPQGGGQPGGSTPPS